MTGGSFAVTMMCLGSPGSWLTIDMVPVKSGRESSQQWILSIPWKIQTAIQNFWKVLASVNARQQWIFDCFLKVKALFGHCNFILTSSAFPSRPD